MTVVVFKSKTDVFAFVERARDNGISASVVGTPKEIKIGCGLSAKIPRSQIYFVKKIINDYQFSTFYGVFTLEKLGGVNTLKKIF